MAAGKYWWLSWLALVISFLALPWLALSTDAQQRVSHYILVTNATTQQPIGSAVCRLQGESSKWWTTSSSGVVMVSMDPSLATKLNNLEVTKAGFVPIRHAYLPQRYIGDTLQILLQPHPLEIPNYTVYGKRLPYQEKNNTAVELVKRAIVVEDYYRRQQNHHSYRKIDLLTLALSNFRLENRWLNRLFPFFHQYIQHSKLDGSWVLPLSQRERVSHIAYNAEEQQLKEEIQYQQLVGLDENIDDGTMTVSLEELFPNIDLFEGSVKLLNSQFASPLSPNSTAHYRYFLTDTLIYQGYVAQKVEFFPKEPSATVFQGHLLLTTGEEPRLLESQLRVPSVANLNFLDQLIIRQNRREVASETHQWAVSEEELSAAFRLHWNLLSFYVEQQRVYDQFNTSSPDSTLLYAKERISKKDTKGLEIKAYADQLRREQLLPSELGMRSFLEHIRSYPLYRLLLDTSEMLALGYLHTRNNPNFAYGGSYFDIGPIHSIIGKNSVEGLRLRLGGRTTAYLWRNFFLSGYTAYGFGDGVWKYRVDATWSFNKKHYFREEFPQHELTLRHEYDLFTPGQVFENNDKDNLLFNIGTSYLTDRSYRNQWQLTYQNDLSAQLSFKLFGHYFRDYPTGTLEYIQVQRDMSMIKIPYITDVGLGAEIRWSPGERITRGSIQRHSQNIRVQREVPVYRLKHEMSLQRLGSDFTHHHTELSMEQRLWMGIYGRLDYKISLGKTWNQVPYPMLYTPPVNRAFALNKNSFQLLRPMEYVADEWLTAFGQYHMQGMLLNRIPYVKRLGLRGVLSTNFLIGNTSKKNSQSSSSEIFVLPTIATEMHYTPYLEIGFGLENIFKIGRIDVYRRMTAPGPNSDSPWGVKGSIRFDF